MQECLAAFMDECIYPAEAAYARSRATSLDPHHVPPVVEDLKVEARSRGLWNLFLPAVSASATRTTHRSPSS
jgi:acyl-CoA dehydrogenase